MHLVAVHGYPLDRRMWAPLAALAADGGLGAVTSVFAPDLRGRGTSRRPSAEIHTMALLADDVAADIEALLPPAEPFLLAGLSMGGYVVLEMLKSHGTRFGERLAGVALCDTRAAADDDAGRARRREAIEAIRKNGIESAVTAMLPKLLSRSSRGTETEGAVRAMILATPPATACADLAGMAVRDEGFEALAELERPLLLVAGEEDVLTPPSDAEAMAEVAARSPYVRLLTIPGAGHLAPLENPREVAAGLVELARRAKNR